jgi:MFS transporter, MHS family, proline/betaine transporter
LLESLAIPLLLANVGAAGTGTGEGQMGDIKDRNAGVPFRAIAAATLGNAFEWFDFAVYGMFAAIIAKLYFPASDSTTSLLFSFGAFGLSFVARPLGGLVLGLYADRRGRKAALSVVILLMTIGTAMIAFLPTYAAIGIAAPALIIVARLIQGFSAGGEFSSGTAMLVEFVPERLRGLFGSFQMAAIALAYAAGNGCAYILFSSLDPAALESWGWRIPFLAGILIGPIGYYIRSRVQETPDFLANNATRASSRGQLLREILFDHPRQLLAAFGLVVVGTVSSYGIVIYLPTFAVTQLGIAPKDAQLGSVLGSLALLVLCPLAGWLSDRIGRKPILLPAIILYGLMIYPCFSYLVLHPTALIPVQLAACVVMSFIWGPTPSVLAEVFPSHVRATGMAISYNSAVMLFGGLAPFYSTSLIALTGDKIAPAYYVCVSALIGAAAVLLLDKRETRLSEPLPRAYGA